MFFSPVLHAPRPRYVPSTEQLLARKINRLPSFLHSVIIGQLLSDASAERRTRTANTRICWGFGQFSNEYASFINSLFSLFTNYGVALTHSYSLGEKLDQFYVRTVTLPLFNYYHELFYVLNAATGRYIKIVPKNIISLIDPIVLAHIIIGDGGWAASEVRIATHSFTEADVNLLAESIRVIGLDVTVRRACSTRHWFILVIPSRSLPLLRTLVVPFTCPSMMYRLGLENEK